MKIRIIKAREIIDSRGNPTVEAQIILDNGMNAFASVPSGASTGIHEAHELRDNDKHRFFGMGVLKAVKNVEQKISKVLQGKDVRRQQEIDRIMIALDGTPNKEKLGANAILSVSLACARAASLVRKRPLYESIRFQYKLPLKRFLLPIPTFNIFNGGKHADTNLDVQEIMVIPWGMRKFKDRVRAGYEIFHALGALLHEKGMDTDVGNEGGYAPRVHSTEEAFGHVVSAVKLAGYKPGKNVLLGTDIGASELYQSEHKRYNLSYSHEKRRYVFTTEKASFSNSEMIEKVAQWVRKYPFLTIEDPLAQDEWDAWQIITKRLKKFILVGDDLFVTSTKRLQKGIDMKVANAVLIKVNQIGTLSETMDCILLARQNGYKIIVSHRSGETTDDFIADLAVAVNADFVKMGSSRGERVCKYNRIMEIEREISK